MGKEIFVGNISDIAKKPLIFVGSPNNIAKKPSIFVGTPSNQAVKVFPSFPDAYQKVEYIMNVNNTEYINAGFKPDSNTRTIVTLSTDGYFQNGIRLLFGVDETYGIYYQKYSTLRRMYFYYNGTQLTNTNIADNTVYTIDFNRSGGKFYIDDTLVASSTATFAATASNYNLFRNGGDTCSLYHFQAWHNNTIIRDMYPCYRKSDIEVGMYDIVNGVFYDNDGSGIFYKGPDVN